MIIRRATVTNFGCLSGPIAIEFGDGLNIIHGPNETGKTTFLRAIRWALMMRAKSTINLDAIKPRSTGAHPEVELQFSRGGVDYQLHKQFRGASGSVSLQVRPPNGSPSTLTDDAAEQRLREVMGVEDPGTSRRDLRRFMGVWPLLWVEQGRSGRPPSADLSDRGRDELGNRLSALSGEVMAGSGGEGLLAAVEAEYSQFWTGGGTETRASKAAIVQAREALAAAESQATTLRERQDRYAATLDRFGRVEREMSRLDDQLPELQRNLEQARAASKELEALRQRLDGLKQQVQIAELQAQAATEQRETRAQTRSRIAELQKTVDTRREEQAAAEQQRQDLADERPPLQAALDAAKSQQTAAARWLERLRNHATWLQQDEHVRNLESALEKARAHRQRCLDLKAKIDGAQISPAAFAKLRQLQDGARDAEAQLQALATALELESDDARTVRLDDSSVDLAAGKPTRLVIAEPRTLDLDGLRIRVTPGGTDLGERRDQAAAARAEVDRALDALGVDSVAAAESALEQLETWKRELKTESDMYAHFAPGDRGFDRLESEATSRRERLESLAAKVAELAHADDPDMPADADAADDALAAAEQAGRRLDEAVETAKEALDAQDRRLGETTNRAETLRTLLAESEGQLSSATDALAAAIESAGDDAALAERVSACAAELAAQRQGLEKAEAELQARNPEQVQITLTQAEKACQNAEREKETQRHERIRLEAELENHELMGLHERLAAAEAAQDDAASEVAALVRRANAVKLLYDTLNDCRDTARQRYLAPLRDEANKLLRFVFPGADLGFADDFSLAHLQRDASGTDEFDALSGGGKEQLGLVIRLAMARVLAAEEPLAVMLDDAFVSSDDERFRDVAALLQHCSDRLQIILATCHWSRYRSLGVDLDQTTDLAALVTENA